MVQSGDVDPFLQRDEVGSPATVTRLRNIISDNSKKAYLKIELAAVITLRNAYCHCYLQP
jgi:hypothetical protein